MSQDVRFHHVRGEKLFLNNTSIQYDNEEKTFTVDTHKTKAVAKSRLRNLSKKDWTLASIRLNNEIVCAVSQRHEKDVFTKYNGRKISYERLMWWLNTGCRLTPDKIDALGFIYIFDYNPEMNIKKEFLNAFSDRQRIKNKQQKAYLVKDIGC